MERKVESIDNDGNVTSTGIDNYDNMTTESYSESFEETTNYNEMPYNNDTINEDYDVFGNSQQPKKGFNKKLLLIPLILLIIIIIAIVIFAQSNNKYNLKTKTITIKITEEAQIEIEAEEKVKNKLTFQSEDEKVATVDDDGTVTGISVGNTIIYVGIDGKKSNKVNVKVETNKEELEFVEKNIVIAKDGTYQLELKKVLDEDLFTWSSNNEDVAIVDQYGLVTGIHAGEATITVTESDGRKTSTRVTVTSEEVLIDEITITNQTIAVGEKITLTPTISPSNGLTILTWSSNREDVATVDENGVVTGLKNGTATITVTTHNGKTARAKITVDESIPASISLTGCTGGIAIGTPIQLTVNYTPSSTSSTITWKSSDTNIATVSGGKVTAKNVGNVTITATTKNGKSATCNLKVSPMAITKLSTSTTSFSLDQGASKTINVEFTPSNAKNYYTLTWKSSNTEVATVDSKGKVVGVNPGQSTITASAGGKSISVVVTVNASSVTSVEMSGCQSSIEVGETFTLTAKALPTTAKNTTISWSSSDTSVATVSSGKVTAKDTGTVTITASTSNGQKATCKVTVNKPTVSNLQLSVSSATLSVNGTKTITATTNLSSSVFNKYYTLKWSSSNPDVVSVTPNSSNSLKATIKGLKAGAATIHVQVGYELITFSVVVS